MSTAANKAGIQRTIEEFFNQGIVAVADDLIAGGYAEHSPAPREWPIGLAGIKHAVMMFHTAFPDFHWAVEDMIVEGDKVAVVVTAHGTHRGELMGLPPTGKQAIWTEIHIIRIADGKQAEHWGVRDMLGILQQLGFVQI
jgi:predicted ester cyclase